jgi:putative tryptophan/tyrosine transport system substrate-binding protein
MDRRTVLASLGLGMLAASSARAQQPAGTPRIGVLGLTPWPPSLSESFKQGLADRGYVEGQNITLEVQDAAGKPARLSEIAGEFTRRQVDIVLARGAGAVIAAKEATSRIPIVAIDLESDPVAMGAVRNLAQPGGNITGVFLDLPDLTGKQLQLLKEALPTVSRVAVFGDPTLNAPQFLAAETAARSLGFELQRLEVRTANEIEGALESARRKKAHAVLLLSSPLVFYHRSDLGALAARKRLLAVSMFVEFSEAGGLMAYGPSLRECFRRGGGFAGRILQGARPANMPVERPTTFELVINRTTAKALGLTMPTSLVSRADRLVE